MTTPPTWITCDDCAYAYLPFDDGSWGECRLNPPQLLHGGGEDGNWGWPIFHLDVGCSGCAKGSQLSAEEIDARWARIEKRHAADTRG